MAQVVVSAQPAQGQVVYAQPAQGQVVYAQPPPQGQVVELVPQPGQVQGVVVQQPVVVQPTPSPPMSPGVEGLNAVLRPYAALKVVQKFEWLEAITQGCFEQPNSYKIYGGADFDSATELVAVATEKSSGCTRVCCKPGHGTLIHVRHATEFSHVYATLERPGAECCFSGNGCGVKPCLCCWAVTESCTDGLIIHDGEKRGKIGRLDGAGVARVWQPDGGGGCFTPTLHVGDLTSDGKATVGALGTITGPTCLGGCLELCCDTAFAWRSHDESLQFGKIVHLHPPCCSNACCAELCTDTDKFGIALSPDMPDDAKAKALAATLLIDYMFFERDNGILSCAPADPPRLGCTIYVTICLCFCAGCLCPCNLCLPCELDPNGNNGSS